MPTSVWVHKDTLKVAPGWMNKIKSA